MIKMLNNNPCKIKPKKKPDFLRADEIHCFLEERAREMYAYHHLCGLTLEAQLVQSPTLQLANHNNI
jgi:hypothetical protein